MRGEKLSSHILSVSHVWPLLLVLIIPAWSESPAEKNAPGAASDFAMPGVDTRVHDAGAVRIAITNYGVFGPGYIPGEPPANCEFPKGSGIWHLFLGALWLGAVVGEDTLVSTGHAGWYVINEMYPDAYPDGLITRLSAQPDDSDYSPLAVSDEEYLAVYYDTLTDPVYVDYPLTPHRPLGLMITQRSYTWSNEEYEDFVLFDYSVRNIGDSVLKDVCVGIYCDADIWWPSHEQGWADDITGEYEIPMPGDQEDLVVAWAADNDGGPEQGAWGEHSERSVFGISLLTSTFQPEINYNWWSSNGNYLLDWGPGLLADTICDFDSIGTPVGDSRKYYLMANPERDYDQLWGAIDHSVLAWLPPVPYEGWARNIANGSDTRFLYSFGSTDLAPGDSLQCALVIALGENFHTDPSAFAELFNPETPYAFYETLDFTDLTSNILAAKALYDSLRDASTAAGDTPLAELPRAFELRQNYPNPFNRSTTIEFVLDRPSQVTLEVFNIIGQRVWKDELIGKLGANRVEWVAEDSDVADSPSGIYFYRIATDTESDVKKMVFLK